MVFTNTIYRFSVLLKGIIPLVLFICFFTDEAKCNEIIKDNGSRPKVGLVLSGGGAKGLAHIGVLKVLEELGIPIDYIGGTSMGGIVGGLYAIGYDAESLEEIAYTENWDKLLSDNISRRELSMEEKEADDLYFISFPIEGRKLKLPSGLVAGHNISKKLTRLTSSIYYKEDFSNLPIPFLCVATDIENGVQVVLKEGNLAEAMRASMAIPTVFTPQEIDGKLLVDGGVINNFPVKEVKEMGADIIIGVNVGFRYYNKEELNSLIRIIEQAVFIHQNEENDSSRNMCDILIEPDLKDYNASSFNDVDSLITRGERAARMVYGQLKALADSMHKYPQAHKISGPLKEIPSIMVRSMEIEGLNNVSSKLVEGKIGYDFPVELTLDDIESAIDRLYSSQFFEKITYQLEPGNDGVILKLNVTERQGDFVKVGIHYDSEFKSLVLLNATLRNLLLKGSRFSFELGLGENPRVRTSYFVHTNWRPSVSIGLRTNFFYLDLYSYENDLRSLSFRYNEESAGLILKTDFEHNISTGVEMQFQNTYLRRKVGIVDYDLPRMFLMNYRGFLEVDTYNRSFFPTSGLKYTFEVKYSKTAFNLNDFEDNNLAFMLKHHHAEKISKNFSILTHLRIGATFGDSIFIPNYYLVGGLNEYQNLFPFTGLNLSQSVDSKAFTGEVEFQWNVYKNHYFIASGNLGKTSSSLENMFSTEDWFNGIGITYGFNSVIGPLKITLMKSNRNNKVIPFVNLGLWF